MAANRNFPRGGTPTVVVNNGSDNPPVTEEETGSGSQVASSSDASLFAKSVRHFLSPVLAFLEDATISEILVNGHDDIYIERAGQLEHTAARFPSEESLRSAVTNIAQFVGRTLDDNTPRMDARLPDGSRVHVVLPPCSRRGIVVAIRKFSRSFFNLDILVEKQSLSRSAAAFLELCVRLRKNILVSGGTGTGKTSFLNALSCSIPEEERIIVIEDSSELQVQQPHTVPLEARLPDARGRGAVTIRDLFISSLRMRPDRIVIGEVRSGEALDLLQAMTSGHSGSMSTLHADHPIDSLRRLETMALMGSMDLPLHAVRAQVASAIDLIVQLSRFSDGSRKVSEISEALALDESGQYQIVDLYRFRQEGIDSAGKVEGDLVPAGNRPSFSEMAKAQGFHELIEASNDLWSV